jgi:CRP-like cAMP-binding protein
MVKAKIYSQLIEYIRDRVNVTEAELEQVLACFKPVKAKKDEVLIAHGRMQQKTFFVSKGCVRIFFINDKGLDATRYFAFESQFATALVSFITGQPTEEFIQAVEASELLCITQKDFYHLLEQVPAWEKFYRSYLEKAYVNNTNRLMSLLTMDALSRYRLLLEQAPVIVQRLPNKLVASYLNISQATLSRLKSKL